MFLAWKELRHAKGKFSLIVALVALVAYLVYFLTSLAYGLASSYTNGITAWNADHIVLTSDANDNIMMSTMTDDDFTAITVTGEKAKLGLFPAVIRDTDDPEGSKEEIYAFGVENGSFIAPDVTLNDFEAVADDSLIDLGYELGDTIELAGTDIEWTIVGFNTKSTYQTAAVLYVNIDTWMDYRFNRATIPVTLYSGIVISGAIDAIADDGLVGYTIDEFINTLPGYNAQVLTFSIMIIFLIIIVAFVLGIFIYVLTIQKTPMFGVMKAQGISNSYIGGSVVMQTLIITGFGIFIGLALTIISGIFLGGFVPFAINPLFYAVITLAFFLFSVTGGMFSVRAVLKIDPRIAIG